MEKVAEELMEFIRLNILSKDVEVTQDTVLKEVGVDSFSIVEIILFIERKYDKLIPDHLLVPETFATIRRLAEVVDSIEPK